MTARIASHIALSIAFAAGTLLVAERMSVAQTSPANAAPAAPAAVAPANTVPAAPNNAASSPVAPADSNVKPAPTSLPAPIQATSPAANSSVAAVPPASEAPAARPPAPLEEKKPTAPDIAIPTPLPPERPAIVEKKDAVPAKYLFASEKLPSLGKAMAIGYYPRGCLAGGVALPVNGPTWQVMRVSRNRMWGHPSLVRFVERFAPLAAKATGWNGILVGDLAQPRGGPLPYGHKSHQIGLDVDIWFMPMPDRVLTSREREKISAINLVSDDWKGLNPKTWTPQHIAFIKTAAEQPEVERVLVNAAIKKEICRVESKNNPAWLTKVRPWYGHHDHIHVRLKCPAHSQNCRKQPPVPGDNGCGKELDHWFSNKVLRPQKPKTPPAKPPHALTLAELPPTCKTVLNAPARNANLSTDGLE